MPTFNEYKNENGYYIRARPSSVDCPITYQVEPRGEPIVESFGLTHQDDVSWDVIQVLKSLCALSTGESGIIGSDEFVPDHSQYEETTLTKQEAYDLVEAIEENQELAIDDRSEIFSLLGIDSGIIEEMEITIPISREIADKVEENQIVEDWGRKEHALFYKSVEAIEEVQKEQDIEFELNGVQEGRIAGKIVEVLTTI